MAYVRVRKSGSAELQVKHALLPGGVFYATFDTAAAARDYGVQLERLLAAGQLPRELAARAAAVPTLTLGVVIREYMATQALKPWADEVLTLVRAELASHRVDAVTYRWAEAWVRGMKVDRHLVPGTIRKRVGALAACLDWHARRADGAVANPLRLLPRGYSTYGAADRRLARLPEGQAVPRDRARDRRLEVGEEDRIRRVLAGEKRADRERALRSPEAPALVVMLGLALETGMRLAEIYTLADHQVDLAKRTVFLERTKNGDDRQVPLSTPAVALLRDWLRRKGRIGMVFPWYSPPAAGPAGHHDAEQLEARERKRVTALLSAQWRTVFDYARCPGLTFHDLRHEAACRVYERTRLSDVQIARMFGWRDPRMGVKYASLRGSDLAAGLW